MNFLENLKSFIFKCARVWNVTRKPTVEEFKTIAKASMIGILLMGLIGFLIATFMNIFNL